MARIARGSRSRALRSNIAKRRWTTIESWRMTNGAPMTEGESSKNWKELLDEVMAEADKEKLEGLAQQLENALFLRSQELEAGSGSTEGERLAIKAAIDKLLRVKVEKLGFPMDPKLLRGGARES